MYYHYNKNSEIYAKSDTEPIEGQYCISDVEFDLTLYLVIVGMIDKDKYLTYYTQKAKPAEQLAQIIRTQQTENDVLGQTIADISLQNMRLNTTLDTLSKSLALAQLDIMALKGGAS
nr:MAG TPA: hypothetical protein [Caudoviricetes sp.]